MRSRKGEAVIYLMKAKISKLLKPNTTQGQNDSKLYSEKSFEIYKELNDKYAMDICEYYRSKKEVSTEV
jgi:trehalose-6-phosphate synthase